MAFARVANAVDKAKKLSLLQFIRGSGERYEVSPTLKLLFSADLNVFLRDFMLDEPETFAIASSLVNEFGELNEAHQEVVAARMQIQTLKPAREEHMELERGNNDRKAPLHSSTCARSLSGSMRQSRSQRNSIRRPAVGGARSRDSPI